MRSRTWATFKRLERIHFDRTYLSTVHQEDGESEGETMTFPVIFQIPECKVAIALTRQARGFYISRDGHVLVYWPCDTTNQGNIDAIRLRFEQITDLYCRLCSSEPKPSDLIVNTVAWIVNPPPPNHHGTPIPNGNTVKALIRRGIIRPKQGMVLPRRVHHFEPVYKELEDLA